MNNKYTILVKKWLDHLYGNTYHSVQFNINNNIFHSGKTYGYGDHYRQTFKEMLLEFNKAMVGIMVAQESDFEYIVIDIDNPEELNEIHKYK